MRGDDISPFIICIFYISWIFLGNFILLNLFLAILLDSFLEEEEEELSEQEREEKRRQKFLRAEAKRKVKDANKVYMGKTTKKKALKQPETSKLFFGEIKGDDEEDLEDLDEE